MGFLSNLFGKNESTSLSNPRAINAKKVLADLDPNIKPFGIRDSLALKLLEATDSLSQHLRSQFSDDTQGLLQEWNPDEPLSRQLQTGLVDGLNKALEGPSLHNEQHFSKISLTEETQELISLNLRGKDLSRFNRLLLDQAYPNGLAWGNNKNSLEDEVRYLAAKMGWPQLEFKVYIQTQTAEGSGKVYTTWAEPVLIDAGQEAWEQWIVSLPRWAPLDESFVSVNYTKIHHVFEKLVNMMRMDEYVKELQTNKWKEFSKSSISDLTGFDLSGVDFSGGYGDGSESLVLSNFMHANLTGANLSGTNLEGAHFQWSNLTEANLSRAKFCLSELDFANLTNANLTESDLRGASLIDANLVGADLTGARLKGGTRIPADLTGAKYNSDTRWPEGFDPSKSKTIFVEELV